MRRRVTPSLVQGGAPLTRSLGAVAWPPRASPVVFSTLAGAAMPFTRMAGVGQVSQGGNVHALPESAPLGCERNARQVRGRVLAGVLRRRASKGYVEGDCDHDTLFYPSSRLTERHRGRIFRGPHHLQWGKRRNRWVRRSFAPADQHQHPHGRPREPQDRAKLIRVLKATLKGPQRGSQRPTNSRPHQGP